MPNRLPQRLTLREYFPRRISIKLASLPLMFSAIVLAPSSWPQGTPGAGQVAFDAASVKPSELGPPPGFPKPPPGRVGGTYTEWHIPLRVYIDRAFKLAPHQVSVPQGVGAERYDITARMPPDTTDDGVTQMLQTLLLERFKMQFHWEQREEPVYALVVGKDGPKFKLADGEDEPGFHQLKGGGLECKKCEMRTLALLLARWEDRPVVDMTGLAGYLQRRAGFRRTWAS